MISLWSFRWNVIFFDFSIKNIQRHVYLSTIRVKIWENNRNIELRCKSRNRHPPFTSFPTCQNRCSRSPSSKSRSNVRTRCIRGPFCSPLLLSWRGSLQPFCGLFAVFCKKHGGRKFHLVHVTGFTVHWIVSKLDASCRSRSTEPEEWIELVFSIFACNTRFPIENSSSCARKRNRDVVGRKKRHREASEQWWIDFIFYTKIIPFVV